MSTTASRRGSVLVWLGLVMTLGSLALLVVTDPTRAGSLGIVREAAVYAVAGGLVMSVAGLLDRVPAPEPQSAHAKPGQPSTPEPSGGRTAYTVALAASLIALALLQFVTTPDRRFAGLAIVAALFGAASLAWVIVSDVRSRRRRAVPPPDRDERD